MRQIYAIIRRFRYQLQRFPIILPKNWHYRNILDLLERAICLLTCRGEIYSTEAEVTQDMTFLRGPDVMAKRTIISNYGIAPVSVFENGSLVAIVSPGESREMSLSSRFILESKVEFTDEFVDNVMIPEGILAQDVTTTVGVTTFRRCACGDPYVHPYGEGPIIEPVGGDLI